MDAFFDQVGIADQAKQAAAMGHSMFDVMDGDSDGSVRLDEFEVFMEQFKGGKAKPTPTKPHVDDDDLPVHDDL